jgi:hypothetical protein
LIEEFPRYLDAFDRELPFARAGQADGHVATLRRWQELGGDVGVLVRDETFLTTLYRTLQAWGIGRRGSRLVPFDRFQERLLRAEPRLVSLQSLRISDPAAMEAGFVPSLWSLIAELGIVDNLTPMVPGTKTLHHVLPMLVVPIDRLYTGTFFAWTAGRMQNAQPQLFEQAYAAFTTIARAVDLSKLTGPGWRMSAAKLIDNAIVGYCRAQGLAGAGTRPKPSSVPRSGSASSGGKYGPLRDALMLHAGTFEMDFAEIDAIVGGLPRSAWVWREWWGNHTGNPQGASWLAAGKRVEHVDLQRRRVRFRSD